MIGKAACGPWVSFRSSLVPGIFWSGNWREAKSQSQTTRHPYPNLHTVELSDADLVARVLVDDDQHAFGELVRRHQSSVRGLLRQLTRTDIALADDLSQEAFLRAYKHIRSFRGASRFSTWLYRIAYNCFREDARRRKELVGINEEQWQAEQDPQVATPASRPLSKQR